MRVGSLPRGYIAAPQVHQVATLPQRRPLPGTTASCWICTDRKWSRASTRNRLSVSLRVAAFRSNLRPRAANSGRSASQPNFPGERPFVPNNPQCFPIGRLCQQSTIPTEVEPLSAGTYTVSAQRHEVTRPVKEPMKRPCASPAAPHQQARATLGP
jgi:hypothetical protein